MRMTWTKVVILAVVLAVLGTGGLAFTSTGTISDVSVGVGTDEVTADEIRPAACSALSLGAILTGSSVTGGPGSELIWGTDGDDALDGGAGSDCIVGGAGTDTLAGSAGDDVLIGGPGTTFDGGEGNDTCLGGTGSTYTACEST